MRIVSDHRDYYDGVMGGAMDRELLWVRQPREGSLKVWPFVRTAFDYYVVGFCGVVYPVLMYRKSVVGRGGVHGATGSRAGLARPRRRLARDRCRPLRPAMARTDPVCRL